MNAAKKLKDIIADFNRARVKNRQFGAADSEVGQVFRSVLADATNGRSRVPTTDAGWQLYASSMDCYAAGYELTTLAMRAVHTILDAPLRERAEIREIVRGL